MKALVKAERSPGIWLKDIPEPQLGANDVRIRIRKTAIAAPTYTSTTWMTGRRGPSRYRWPWGTNTAARSSSWAAKYRASQSAIASPARATSPAAIAVTAGPVAATCAATPWASG